MALSRQQQIEQNERRLTQIGSELEEIVQIQTKSTDPDEQRGCLVQLNTLEGERRALENANIALQKELEEAVRQKAETDAKIWFGDERPKAERERDEACGKIFGKIRNLKKEYDKLVQVEKRWAQKWNERGRPQGIDHDRPFVSRARRDVYSFLGMDKRPRMSQTTDQKRVAELLGPTARIAAVLASEERRAARKKVEAEESAEKTANDA